MNSQIVDNMKSENSKSDNSKLQNSKLENSKLQKSISENSKSQDENNYEKKHDFSSMNITKACEKVLGTEWDNNKDILRLGVNKIFKNATKISLTKRNILKTIASVYDCIGILQLMIIN